MVVKSAWPRIALALAALIALAHHVYAVYHWNGYSYDQLVQMSGARALLEGHGLSFVQAYPPDPTLRDYRSVVGWWPPGYSWLLAGLLRWTPDIMRAVGLLDVLAVVVLFVSTWYLLRAMHPVLGFAGRAALLGWWGIAASPIRFLSTAESLALASLSAALALTLPVLTGRRRIWPALAGGFLAGFSATFRYAYWPLIVVVPAVLVWLAYRTGRRRLVLDAALHLAAAAAVVLCIVAYHYATLGHAFRPPEVAAGKLYFGQMLSMVPFPARMLGFEDPLRLALLRICGPAGESAVTPILWLLSIAVLAASAWGVLYWLKQKDHAQVHAGAACLQVKFLLVTSTLLFLVTLALLVYLTLRHPRHSDGFVFVNQVRYYAPGFWFLYFGLAGAIAHLAYKAPRVRPAMAATVVLVGCLIAASWLTNGFWRFLQDSPYRLGMRTFVMLLGGEIRSLERAGLPIVFVDTDMSRLMAADAAGAVPMNATGWREVPVMRTGSVSLVVGCSRGCDNPAVRTLRNDLERRGARRVPWGDFEFIEWSGIPGR